jgi:hypothetical protein
VKTPRPSIRPRRQCGKPTAVTSVRQSWPWARTTGGSVASVIEGGPGVAKGDSPNAAGLPPAHCWVATFLSSAGRRSPWRTMPARWQRRAGRLAAFVKANTRAHGTGATTTPRPAGNACPGDFLTNPPTRGHRGSPLAQMTSLPVPRQDGHSLMRVGPVTLRDEELNPAGNPAWSTPPGYPKLTLPGSGDCCGGQAKHR